MSTTLQVADELAARIAAEAARQGVSPDELAARVLAEHVPARRRLSFIGIGRSGHSDTAERHEEIIREAFTARLGVNDIATLDNRHFAVVRPRHTDAFTLLP